MLDGRAFQIKFFFFHHITSKWHKINHFNETQRILTYHDERNMHCVYKTMQVYRA